jgi:hypothetical protein
MKLNVGYCCRRLSGIVGTPVSCAGGTEAESGWIKLSPGVTRIAFSTAKGSKADVTVSGSGRPYRVTVEFCSGRFAPAEDAVRRAVQAAAHAAVPLGQAVRNKTEPANMRERIDKGRTRTYKARKRKV